MVEAFAKKLIKNSENVTDPEVRRGYITFSSIYCIICNIVLFTLKLIIGIISGSIAITADAFNNMSDAASNIVSFIGAKLSGRPADAEHPFGHGRYEYIAGFIVAFLVVEVGFTCFKDSIDRIVHPVETEMTLIQLVILLIPIAVKAWMGFVNKNLSKLIDSTALKATAADSFSDVLTTSVTVIALFIGYVSGKNVDGYMGVLVSLFIMVAGIKIVKETLEPLIGTAASYETYEKISDYVESFDGVYGTHDLIVHNYGPAKLIATIHAEVDDSADMVGTHELIDNIEHECLNDLGIMLTIHMDPIAIHDERIKELKPVINAIVQQYEPEGSIHDLRIVNGENQVNLIFDVVLPHKHTYMEDELAKLINIEMKKIDPKYNCVAEVEHGYVQRNK